MVQFQNGDFLCGAVIRNKLEMQFTRDLNMVDKNYYISIYMTTCMCI